MLHMAGAHALWVRPHFQMDFSEGFFREKRANDYFNWQAFLWNLKTLILEKNPRHFNMKMKTPVKNKSIVFDIFYLAV